MKRAFYILFSAALLSSLSACRTTAAPYKEASVRETHTTIPQTIPQTKPYSYSGKTLSLPDRAAFLQKDKRWASDRLGNSDDTMGTDGCLVTAAAMALSNLGFETDPGDLNARLTQTQSFTPRGWLIWSGIAKVTDGKAKAKFYTSVDDEIIESCLRDGYYPMTRFILPNGRTHWAVILKRDGRGYHMRDPLHPSRSPLLFPRDASAFKAVRCIGLNS